ncbi:MAG TPA: hypothetical protein VL442_20550, partial [Mucilaginibacter sp.]|nr:hypothetical protein [Mucilaginibacter sp.]
MKITITTLVTLSVATMALYSCRKSSDTVAPKTSETTVENLHGMGLNSMEPSEWANVPAFSANLFKGKLAPDGLTYNGTAYSSYLLVTPQIRDQGQTGACTGF